MAAQIEKDRERDAIAALRADDIKRREEAATRAARQEQALQQAKQDAADREANERAARAIAKANG